MKDRRMDDRRSERFGRYEILSQLGRGAMGVVYKARDPKINRVVAVKTVSLEGQPPEEEREYRERFFREAEAAGRLSHPGIVTIFDVGEEPETRAPYIVMEFVGGQSLDKMLTAGDHKLPLETALQLALELAEALDCAHGQGVVHRDLKPANILITEDGHAKIADFGIAKLNLANLTLGGRVLGTPAYMSPEQLNGESVDGRSDLFSLGVVLYTVLTGYRPFQGNSALTVSYKVVNREPVPATVLDTELPAGLDYIIGRAMAKDPAQRYQRGMEMVLDLQDLRDGRELWSKAKQPGSSLGADIEETANARARSWAAARPAAAKPRSGNRSQSGREAVDKLLETMRKNSVAAVAVLLLGLFVFGMRLSETVLPQQPSAPAPAAASVARAANAANTAPTPDVTPKLSTEIKPAHTSPPNDKNKDKDKIATAAKLAHTNVAKLPPIRPAILDIEMEHNFTSAELSVWVDDHPAYSRKLEGTDKRRMVVFHAVQGHESHAIQLAPGQRSVRVQIASGVDSTEQSGTVTGEFVSGKEKMLRIHFNKHGEMTLSLQ
ncbi:MAG: serine/threonine-protein kinase [Candidatus Sulfotelmatobacter sp.]